MGQSQGKSNQQVQAPMRDTMDILLDLKMSQKRLERESNKALKDSETQINKAKAALKKNNEEGARLFLQSAASKKQESTSLLKMAQKIEFIQGTVKSQQANQQLIGQLSRITPVLQQHTQQMPLEQILANMMQFDSALDDVLVQGKIVNSMINKDNCDVHTNLQVDMMFNQMQNELRLQNEELGPVNLGVNQLQQQPIQQQQQYQQQNLQQQQQFQQKY